MKKNKTKKKKTMCHLKLIQKRYVNSERILKVRIFKITFLNHFASNVWLSSFDILFCCLFKHYIHLNQTIKKVNYSGICNATL